MWVAGDNDILHQHLQISSCPYDLKHPYLYLLGFLIAKLYSQKRALLGAHWEEQEVRSVPQRQQGPSGGDIKEQLLGCFPAGLTGDGTAGMGWDGSSCSSCLVFHNPVFPPAAGHLEDGEDWHCVSSAFLELFFSLSLILGCFVLCFSGDLFFLVSLILGFVLCFSGTLFLLISHFGLICALLFWNLSLLLNFPAKRWNRAGAESSRLLLHCFNQFCTNFHGITVVLYSPPA